MRFLLLSSLLLFAPSGASAVPILDQSYEPTLQEIDRGFRVGQTPTIPQDPDSDVAQTFIVGLTGQLTRIDLQIVGSVRISADLEIDVRTVVNDVPTEPDSGPNVLGRVTLPPSAIPTIGFDWVEIDLTALGLFVTAGQALAVVLQSETDDIQGYGVRGSSAAGYAGGQVYSRNFHIQPTWTPSFDGPDLAFRTFVEVPEPGVGLVALSIGVALLRAGRRA